MSMATRTDTPPSALHVADSRDLIRVAQYQRRLAGEHVADHAPADARDQTRDDGGRRAEAVVEGPGVAIGWTDVDRFDLPDQYVDVTGLPSGGYCLISRADPARRLEETNDSTTSGGCGIRSRSRSVRVSPSSCRLERDGARQR